MNKLVKVVTFALILLSASTPVLAKNYSLADGKVMFDAPAAWPAIMEKTNGDPQFFAFHIRNPRATDTLTRITVTTHDLAEVTDFDAYLSQTFSKVRHSTGFSEAAGTLPAEHSLYYHFDQDGRPQVVRLSLFQHGHLAVVLRCQRPKNAKASQKWLSNYRKGCQDLAQQLGN